MRCPKVHNFYDTIRPVLVVAKLILFFFETIDPRSRTIRRTLLDQFSFVTIVLVDLYLIPVGIRGSSGLLHLTDSILINVGCYGAIVLCYLFSLTFLWLVRFKGPSIFQLIDCMAQFDDDMLLLGFSVDHQLWHRRSVMSMCGGISIVALVSSVSFTFSSGNTWLDMSALFPDYWTVIAFTRATVGLNVFGFTFGLMLMFLKTRYSLLNKVMAKFIQLKFNKFHPDQQIRLIRKFATMHDHLSYTMELFNYCYSAEAMFILGAAFFFTVFAIFGLIHAYVGSAEVATFRIAWANMIFDGFCIVFIAQLVVPAALVNYECKMSSTLVHKMVSYGPYHRRVHRELQCFSQQLGHQTSKISCRMFDYDWTLLHTLWGSLVTYLVILIQFDLVNINYAKVVQMQSLLENVFV